MLKSFCLGLTTLLFSGCLTKLAVDPGPPAHISRYPTAEFWAKGKLFHGLGEVTLKQGEPLALVDLKVQGYMSGTVRVDSGLCRLRASENYYGGELLSFPISGPADESCLIDITVSTIFPSAYDSRAVVYELKGQLMVKVLRDGRPSHVASSRVKAKTEAKLFIPFETADEAVKIYMRGCDREYDVELPVKEGGVTLFASELTGGVQVKNCVYEGFIDTPAMIKRVTWNIWGYAPEFTPLPYPELSWKGEKLSVQGDAAVAVVILNQSNREASRAEFAFDPKAENTLRLLTVSGRSVVCRWAVEGGAWTCQQ